MTLQDSGAREDYGTGAVRDRSFGKGRMDLLPRFATPLVLGAYDFRNDLDFDSWRTSDEMETFDLPGLFRKALELANVLADQSLEIAEQVNNDVPKFHLGSDHQPDLAEIYCVERSFLALCNHSLLILSLNLGERYEQVPVMALIEVAKIMELGAEKYAERNWEAGIPIHRFLDSGLRHISKAIVGRADEPHLPMACWNFLCGFDTYLRIRGGLLPTWLLSPTGTAGEGSA